MGPTKENIINIVQEEDGSCSITWLEGDTIYYSSKKLNVEAIVDIPCLISSLYHQYPDLFSKFAK